MSPTAVPLAGGTEVTLSGRGFVDTGALRVLLHTRPQHVVSQQDGFYETTPHVATAGGVFGERAVPARWLSAEALAFTAPACEGRCAAAAASAASSAVSVHVAASALPASAAPPQAWASGDGAGAPAAAAARHGDGLATSLIETRRLVESQFDLRGEVHASSLHPRRRAAHAAAHAARVKCLPVPPRGR